MCRVYYSSPVVLAFQKGIPSFSFPLENHYCSVLFLEIAASHLQPGFWMMGLGNMGRLLVADFALRFVPVENVGHLEMERGLPDHFFVYFVVDPVFMLLYRLLVEV
jgi:hypothetical protein